MILNKDQIEEIRKRASKATPGPWVECLGYGAHLMSGIKSYHQNKHKKEISIADLRPEYSVKHNSEADDHRPNMDFIACSRSDIPHLLDIIDHLQSEIGRLQDQKQKKGGE